MFDAILETGKSRFAPILSTTMTTVLGLSSVARQDEFFAGLSYTIMFGLAFSSAMTLLVVPAIYYDKEKLIQILKRTILSFIVWFALPFAGIA
jgi:multidrug efflux pump subunit AcrB